MRIRNARTARCQNSESGFTLLEMITVVAIGIVLSVVSVVALMPILNGQHVINAYNTTLSAMRQARDNAVAQRTSYSVTFSNTVTPNTIAVAWAPATGETAMNGVTPATLTYSLPTDVTFQTNTAISSTTPPDGGSAGASFGSGTHAIDFGYTTNSTTGGATTIYFCPDGSAQTSSSCSGANNWDNGVVYMAQSSNVLSSRAVDLWGGTGRIHGWRLYAKSGGGYQWVRQ
jgi:type II secretory pathway pseudopilin PulG